MNNYIYIIIHSYDLDDCAETKFIGAFSTLEKAKEIVENYKRLPGFKDYPDKFFIDKYTIDRNHWTEGFSTVYY